MFTSFPAGGGGLTRGRVLKGTGLRAGMPDLEIMYDGVTYRVELKTGTVPLSDAQIATHAALRAAKQPVAVVRSLDELRALMAGPWWPLAACIRETKPSTERVRRGFQSVMYRGKEFQSLDWPDGGDLIRRKRRAKT